MTAAVEYFEFPSDFNRITIESEYSNEKQKIKYDYLSELRKTFYENVRDGVNDKADQTHLQFVNTPVECKKELFDEIIERFWNGDSENSNIRIQLPGNVINDYTGEDFPSEMVAIFYLFKTN